MRPLLALGALATLAACTPGACDPSQAGFLSGIGCEASGSYATRNRYQQSALADASADAMRARANARDEQYRAGDAISARNQARSRLNAVDAETSQLRARLRAARTRGTADQGRLDQAQAELDAVQRQRRAMPASASEEDIRALEARQRRAAEAIGGI